MDIADNISFKEERFFFEEEEEIEKSLFTDDLPNAKREPEAFGIVIRLGNAPIVRNLKKLIELSHSQLPPEIEILFNEHDIYTVTHAIGVMRLTGRAKVEELQYNATIIDLDGAKTIDLLPNTSFKTIFGINSSFEGAIKAGGSFSAQIPDELKQALSNKVVSLGGDIDLQLSTNSQFVGKVQCNLKLPVVTSSGISTNSCTWILNPEENPLLGDQLLIQTIAVPKNTTNITYKIKGLTKVTKGFFRGMKEAETSTNTITLKLNY
jgi:hypothetical protein